MERFGQGCPSKEGPAIVRAVLSVVSELAEDREPPAGKLEVVALTRGG